MKIKLFTATCLGVFWMLIMLLSGQLGLPKAAHANQEDNCSSSQLPWTFSTNTQVFDSLPVGSPIPESDAYETISIKCNGLWAGDGFLCIDFEPYWTIYNRGGGTITETDIPGVYTFPGLPEALGYQFLDSSNQPLPLNAYGRHNTGVEIKTGSQDIPLHFRMVKVKDSPVGFGSAVVDMGLSCKDNEWGNVNELNSRITMSVAVRQITQTCNMVAANTHVTLPNVPRLAFKGVGSATGNTGFTLDFQCEANAAARVNISDATTRSNNSEILTLQASSTATGVGVRLAHHGVPVTLAPNQAFDQGGSQFPLNSSGSAQIISLPFSAEYVQTSNSVTSGTVQALAIVTIAYD